MTSLQAMSRNQSDEANEALAMRFECTGERYCPLFHATWSNIKLGLEHFLPHKHITPAQNVGMGAL
jgi:hypothetical protein